MRRLISAVGAGLLVVVLAGCGILSSHYENRRSDGGETSGRVIAKLEQLPGVVHASFELRPWENPGEGGLFSSSGMDFLLEIVFDDAHRIADPAAFLDTALRLAWSVNDGYSPKGSVGLLLEGGLDRDFDWDRVLRDDFGTQFAGRDPYRLNVHSDDEIELGERVFVGMVDDDFQQRYGSWPLDPVDVPDGLTARGAPPALDPLAITGLRPSWYTSGEECWTFDFDRGFSEEDGSIYPGVVEVTLLVDGREEATQTTAGRRIDDGIEYDGVAFCAEKRPGTEDSVSFSVVAPAAPGFVGVEVDGLRIR